MVVDSRPTEDGVRRRRHCEACGHRFTTYERPEGDPGGQQERDVNAAARRLILKVLANLPREGGPSGQGAT
jgi:transcription repressor NrdR-like protein